MLGFSMHWMLAHLIGDYVLQNDWMATNKKRRDLPCMVHAILYTIPFLFCSMQPWQLLAIMVQHFLQDRTDFVVWFAKAKGSGPFVDPKGIFFPWSIVALDNVLHILFIALVVWIGSF